MRFTSVMLGLLCLPLLAVAIVLSPAIVPVLFILMAIVPGFTAFRRTSGKRSWNIASFHSPHSLTWRWLINMSLSSMFSRPRLYMAPRRDSSFGTRSHFVAFAFNIGIAGASASTNNSGWQFTAMILGLCLNFSQQRPMWYRELIQRAWDEKDAVVRENRRLRDYINIASHNAARSGAASPVAAHLN